MLFDESLDQPFAVTHIHRIKHSFDAQIITTFLEVSKFKGS